MLQKRRLLGVLGLLILQIRPDRKAMLDPTVQVNLILLLMLLQQPLRLMPLLLGENRIRLRRGNRQRRLEVHDLLRIDETRVRHGAHIDPLAFGSKAGNVFGAEAVADAAEFLDAVGAAELFDDSLDNGVDLTRSVAFAFRPGLLEPLHDVEALGAVQGDGVAFEEVGHGDEVAIGGELVGDAGERVSREGFRTMLDDRTAER